MNLRFHQGHQQSTLYVDLLSRSVSSIVVDWRLGAGAVCLAFVPRAVTAAGRFTTADESRWMRRSEHFGDALARGDFGDASASLQGALATMPGVTTMWIGSLARLLWRWSGDLGMIAGSDSRFAESASALNVAQMTMAAATAALVGVLVVLVALWAGRRCAAVVGVLVATEPFIVAHGAVLHTDELTALCGVASLVAAALVLGVPQRTSLTGSRAVAAISGALFGAALLTKLSALALLPSLLALGVWGVAARLRCDGWVNRRDAVLSLARLGVWASSALVVVVAVAYPAIWVEPIEELRLLRQSGSLATAGHQQFFLGEITRYPGVGFYPMVLPLRMTPWFLLAAVVSAAAVWCRRSTAAYGMAAVAMALPTLLVTSLATKQFDRYGLPILVIAAVVVGVATADSTPRRTESRIPVVAGLATALLIVHTLAVAPWGLAYFNPVLGGGAAAQRLVLVGWGEALEKAGPIIAQREGNQCQTVTIYSMHPTPPGAFPCGSLVHKPAATTTYVVVYINKRQRTPPATILELIDGRRQIAAIKVRDITYVDIYARPTPQRT